MNLHDVCDINENITDKRAFKELNVVIRSFVNRDKKRIEKHSSTEAMIIQTRNELEEIHTRVCDMLERIERANY